MAYLRGFSTLTPSQIRTFTDVNPLLDTAIDCLYFVTEFFEVISQSGPHIYHSALQFASLSSMVRKLYIQQIYSPMSGVVNGVTASEDSCIASVKASFPSGVWSPCGQFIAVYMEYPEVTTVEIRDPNTLEMVSALEPPSNDHRDECESAVFSPDGHLLACGYSG